ncbi:hypothetical protein N7466_011102 [Penicillium verhagenii]|uniref:uncharacterized protein n=1 Tax=Penicillium verhagenii TaxID=1562060 RepID=UPI00254536C3|nr:uncharacterized protein N7466_011102 [Penicillium verhagenii]KAJ5917548.1 hypothetical protein N7466_011102 [Penicillium verhagenii]
MTLDAGPKLKLLKESISLVKQNSIVSSSGREYSVDFIVLATGFEFTQWQAHSVVGRRGKTLQQHWDSMGGAGAYQTVALDPSSDGRQAQLRFASKQK